MLEAYLAQAYEATAAFVAAHPATPDELTALAPEE